MANRRMFSMTIIDTDYFLELPDSSQVLYFHLAMRADDDGFISSPKRISRMIGASDDDLKLLFNKEFLIPFESGVCVITHWKIHNYIRKDRYTPTFHKLEKSLLGLTENNTYSTDPTQVEEWLTVGQPLVDQVSYQRLPQDRLDKDRLEIELDKDRLEIELDIEKDKDSMGANAPEASASKIGFEAIKNYWNGLDLKPAIRNITAKRQSHIRARIKEFDLDTFYQMLDMVSESEFLLKPDNTWFSFDWCINPNNFTKIIEGKYRDEVKSGGIDSESDKANGREEPWERKDSWAEILGEGYTDQGVR